MLHLKRNGHTLFWSSKKKVKKLDDRLQPKYVLRSHVAEKHNRGF